jgi:hypothetical protein
MSNSLFNIDDARKVASMLQQTYEDLVQDDPNNRVFGDPKEFIFSLRIINNKLNYTPNIVNALINL